MKALTDSKRRLSLSSNFNDDDQDEDDDTMCSGTAVKRSIVYYLKNSTLHGLKYIAEESITIPERVFFGIAFVLVVILSGFFISNVYVKWSASPIIISTSAKQKLTSNMPFPAITICNLNQALLSRVQRISRSSSNFSLLMGLCDQGGDLTISYIGTWKYFKAILVEVAQPCDEMLLYCSFGSRPGTVHHAVQLDSHRRRPVLQLQCPGSLVPDTELQRRCPAGAAPAERPLRGHRLDRGAGLCQEAARVLLPPNLGRHRDTHGAHRGAECLGGGVLLHQVHERGLQGARPQSRRAAEGQQLRPHSDGGQGGEDTHRARVRGRPALDSVHQEVGEALPLLGRERSGILPHLLAQELRAGVRGQAAAPRVQLRPLLPAADRPGLPGLRAERQHLHESRPDGDRVLADEPLLRELLARLLRAHLQGHPVHVLDCVRSAVPVRRGPARLHLQGRAQQCQRALHSALLLRDQHLSQHHQVRDVWLHGVPL
ncbi:GL16515 [Drosophila persimilis]|uniref:GL16515 n=1 Tax=Drosophila persimilis TaxID=7234 RepID=B4GW90_DROPE|nr:GL16515 [Drosophila persimilis]